jgi:hypothetical protein
MGFLDGLFQRRKHVRHDAEDDDTDPNAHTVLIKPVAPPSPPGAKSRRDDFERGGVDPFRPELPQELAPPSEDAPIPPPRAQPPMRPPPRLRPQPPPPDEGGGETVFRPQGASQRAGRVVAVLVGVEGSLENEVYRVFEGENVLGRFGKPEPFPNTQDTKTISREHATLRASGEHFLIEPTNPKNATFVNGQPVEERSLVQHGDRIGLGATRTATFVLLVVPTSV